ncbi:MAG: 1-acyl-sn-glycerol-3-phosphate acyltransferase [Acidobacteriota bacterium]
MNILLIAGRDALSEGIERGLRRRRGELSVWRFRSAPDFSEVGADFSTAPTSADAGASAAVYLAGPRGKYRGVEPDLKDAEACFRALATSGVEHAVVMSSAAVHEPSAHHLQWIDEVRCAPRRTGNPIPDRWQALERLAEQHLAAGGLTVLRPTPTLVPGGRDFWSRRVRRRLALTTPGYDPVVQLLDLEDLLSALGLVIDRAPAAGTVAVYHVAPAAPVPLAAALRRAQTIRLPVPVSLQAPVRALLAAAGRAAPTRQLDWTRHPSTVSDRRIRGHLGYAARYSSLEAIDRCRTPSAEPRRIPIEPDRFGLDKAYHRRLSKTLFRFLQRLWWRVDYRGLERVPTQGPAVLAGVHRGFQPWDGVMAMDQIVRTRGRYLRFLVHPTLFKPPVLTPYMQKLGGVPACRAHAEWVLDGGGLLGIFPEGIRGAFRPYGPDVYRLGKFGRNEYVRFAIRAGAPIVPFVTVGSAEIFPILGRVDWPWWRRVVEWPYFPITPTLGLVPLPAKWHTRFLEPEPTEHFGPEAAEDREIVSAVSQRVKERMQAALEDLLARRRHRFWGDLSEYPAEAGGDGL